MNTSTKPSKSNGKKESGGASADKATTLLRADHEKVTALFKEYEKARASSKKKDLVGQICTELTVHAQIEEEIFYPAVKQALKDGELVPEAFVEHGSLKELIAQVEGVEPDGEMFDARIKVLSEYVEHHVKEEQDEIFPKAEASKLDLMALGKRLQQRKQELLAGTKRAS